MRAIASRYKAISLSHTARAIKTQNADAAETWCKENDSEGVAFEYDVFEVKAAAN